MSLFFPKICSVSVIITSNMDFMASQASKIFNTLELLGMEKSNETFFGETDNVTLSRLGCISRLIYPPQNIIWICGKVYSRRIFPPQKIVEICGPICSRRYSNFVFPLKGSHAIEWPLKTRPYRFFFLLSRLRISESGLAILACCLCTSRELVLFPSFRVWVSHSPTKFVLCMHNVAFNLFCFKVDVVALFYIFIHNNWWFIWSNVVITCTSIPLQWRDCSEALPILSPLFPGAV